jgi:hypothetical protein
MQTGHVVRNRIRLAMFPAVSYDRSVENYVILLLQTMRCLTPECSPPSLSEGIASSQSAAFAPNNWKSHKQLAPWKPL